MIKALAYEQRAIDIVHKTVSNRSSPMTRKAALNGQPNGMPFSEFAADAEYAGLIATSGPQNVIRATSVPVRWNWDTSEGPVAPNAVLIQPNPAVG